MIFFSNSVTRAITTGKEISPDVINDLLSSNEKGNKCYQYFVQQRLVSNQHSIYQKISKNKIRLGISKQPKTPKPIEVLREDVQGFGILAEQRTSLKEAFNYPITTLPLSIAESNQDLRGASNSSKSKFRNQILKKTNSVNVTCPRSAVWIYDAGKIIRCQPPERTYKMFFDKIIEKMTPRTDSSPLSVHIVLDKYIKKSTKSGAMKMRGIVIVPRDCLLQVLANQCLLH